MNNNNSSQSSLDCHSLLNSEQLPYNRTIVFIDAQVEDYLSLIPGIDPQAHFAVLDADQDGIQQITHILQSDSYNQIHIIAHGAPGCLYLGNSKLNLQTLDKYTSYLQSWFANYQSHYPPRTLLLYGCNLAEGDRGEQLITKLRKLTGAEIAASTNLIGNQHLGGNWDLNATTSEMNVTLAIDKAVLNSYPGVLATFTVTTVDDEADEDTSERDLSLREAIALANSTDGTDAIGFRPVVEDLHSFDNFDDLDTNGSGVLDELDERVGIIGGSTVIDFSDVFERSAGSDTITVVGITDLASDDFLFATTI